MSRLPPMKNNTRFPAVLMALLAGFILASPAQAQKAAPDAVKLPPDMANEHYGPHERNVLDLWKAKADKPTPLVVYIHGGGFRAGSKETINPAPPPGSRAKGIPAMGFNYRFSPGVTFPAPSMDTARRIQY